VNGYGLGTLVNVGKSRWVVESSPVLCGATGRQMQDLRRVSPLSVVGDNRQTHYVDTMRLVETQEPTA
jgi:hypothetical protein